MRINSGDLNSDKAEVFFTDCLRKYPFPEIPGETFLGEDLVWIRMSLKYNMKYINKTIYIGNYLQGGLTNNRRSYNIRAPKGCLLRAKEFMRPQIKLIYRLKGNLQYVIYSKFAGFGIRKIMKETNDKRLTSLAILPGWVLYHIWKYKDDRHSK